MVPRVHGGRADHRAEVPGVFSNVCMPVRDGVLNVFVVVVELRGDGPDILVRDEQEAEPVAGGEPRRLQVPGEWDGHGRCRRLLGIRGIVRAWNDGEREGGDR